MYDITPLICIGLVIVGIIIGMIITMMYVDDQLEEIVQKRLKNGSQSHGKSSGGKK